VRHTLVASRVWSAASSITAHVVVHVLGEIEQKSCVILDPMVDCAKSDVKMLYCVNILFCSCLHRQTLRAVVFLAVTTGNRRSVSEPCEGTFIPRAIPVDFLPLKT